MSDACVGFGAFWSNRVSMLFWIMEFVQPEDRDRIYAAHPSPLVRLACVQLFCSQSASMKVLARQEGEHDSLIPWIIRNSFSRRIGEGRLPSADAISEEWKSLTGQYARIADRLEEHQEARSNPLFRGLANCAQASRV